MYEQFYGLRERPFELTPNPRFLVLTPRHREALSNLYYGISGGKGITVLIGEAGTGKTTLLRTVLANQVRADALCVHINNPTLTRAEFVELLAHGFGLSTEARTSKAALLRELAVLLTERQAQGLLSVLIIDEAQSLPHELLEEVRLLANLDTTESKLLSVVLAGQPELAGRLNESGLRQLKQRVALRCELAPLTLTETEAYVARRLSIAGGECAQTFARDVFASIFRASGGIPRLVSVICDNALLSGFALGQKPVTREVVAEVCHDFDLGTRRGSTAPALAVVAPPPTEIEAPRQAAAPAKPVQLNTGTSWFGLRRRRQAS